MEKKQTFIDSSNILKTLRFLSRIPCASLHVPIYAAGAPFFPCKANVWADAQNNIQNKPNQEEKKNAGEHLPPAHKPHIAQEQQKNNKKKKTTKKKTRKKNLVRKRRFMLF